MQLKDKIFAIRNEQVMLDRDLAKLYGIETRALKQAVNRNSQRFPKDFMLTLDENEMEAMVSQSVIPSKKYFGGARPYAFTEQGVAMLSSILNSKKAIEINIRIMRAFIQMRRHQIQNSAIYYKFQQIDQKLLIQEKSLEEVFKAIGSNQITPKQGIYYENQVYDAHELIVKLIKKAKERIILIDNYVNEETLTLLSNRGDRVKIIVYTKNISAQLNLAKQRFNEQYQNLEIKRFTQAHDRFLIIDNQTFHIGASIKDAGKKLFAFTKLNEEIKLFDKIWE